MRKGSLDQAIYKDENGNLQGVSLGFDFCAEHEWGIKRLREKLGMDDNIIGIDRYLPTKGELTPFEFSSDNHSIRSDNKEPAIIKWYGLTSHYAKYPWDNKPVDIQALTKSELEYVKSTEDIQGAWDENDFLFIVKDEKMRNDIYTAFINHDIIIMLGGSQNPFSNAKFSLLIKSRIPEDFREGMKKAHISANKIYETMKNTGIEERLKKAGKKYFALSPKWKDETETDIIYWLNPTGQKENNYGWFTIKDLEDWINNTGKIPIKKEKKGREK